MGKEYCQQAYSVQKYFALAFAKRLPVQKPLPPQKRLVGVASRREEKARYENLFC
jgi:hypothetical protein